MSRCRCLATVELTTVECGLSMKVARLRELRYRRFIATPENIKLEIRKAGTKIVTVQTYCRIAAFAPRRSPGRILLLEHFFTPRTDAIYADPVTVVQMPFHGNIC